eukprot:scaffold313849_cov25-Prasinocladus_malaysianus.AAC.1
MGAAPGRLFERGCSSSGPTLELRYSRVFGRRRHPQQVCDGAEEGGVGADGVPAVRDGFASVAFAESALSNLSSSLPIPRILLGFDPKP